MDPLTCLMFVENNKFNEWNCLNSLKMRGFSPRELKRDWHMTANREIVVKSPKLAAIGVATLSGLMWNLREKRTTPTIREPKATINSNYSFKFK